MKGFRLTLELARIAPVPEAWDIWGDVFRPNEKHVDKLCSRRLLLDTRELDIFENGEGKDLCSSLAKFKPGEGLQFMRTFAESQSVQLLGFPRREDSSWKVIRSICKVANQSEIVYRCISKAQWLRTVSESADPLDPSEILVFHSNIVPREAYLRLVPVYGTCTRQVCTEGFFRILDDEDPRTRQCSGKCDLAEQLKVSSACSEETGSTDKLLPLVEPDAKSVKLLGEGSDGSVSKILYRRGLFARKEFRREGGRSNPSFVKERDVAKEVSHPNIVHIFSSSEIWSFDPGYSCLTMELLQEELDACLLEAARTGYPLSFRDSLLVLLQIAEAMTHLHRKGFVHGDLKPSNIFVSRFTVPHSHVNDQFYLVKVADFGRTQRVDTPSAVQAFQFDIGTLHYKAPEIFKYRIQQIKEEELQPVPNEINLKKTDVYSFGVVAYQVLTGLPSTDLGKGKREETKPRILLLVSFFFSFLISFIFSFLHRFSFQRGHASAPTEFSSEAVVKPNRDYSAPPKFSRASVMEPDGERTQWRPSCDFVGDLEGSRSRLLPLITECWSSSLEKRPDFPTICERIQALYDECFPSQSGLRTAHQANESLDPTSKLRSKKDS